MSKWQTIQNWEINLPIKRGPHFFIIYKSLGPAFPVCKKCGLVHLRNEPTWKRIKIGCDG